MSMITITRREMLGHSVRLALIGSAPALLNACKKPELHCDDLSGLSEEDSKLRLALNYQDVSPHGDNKNCASCSFYRPGKKNECGQCTLVKGPIHPQGYCDSWAAKL